MAAPALSASIVTYRPEPRLLERALASLAIAIDEARAAGEVASARVIVIDNGPDDSHTVVMRALSTWPPKSGSIEVVVGQGNVGYGRANNLAIERVNTELHLIMNPDVELDRTALREVLVAAREHPEVGLFAPAVFGDDGARQYLCKRYPTVWVLFLRGFAPRFMQRGFASTIHDYEMRDVIGDGFATGIPLVSGCFMLVRTALLTRLSGFDPRYFMYFEDYDLSLRLAREAQVGYVPQARILHHGGDAARKGWRHVLYFMRSAWRFFARHGWKIA